jgi:hypothetical protein
VVTVGVGAVAVVVRVALGVVGALDVGFVGVSGSAVTVGMGPVASSPPAPVVGVVAVVVGCAVGDSIAVVCGVVLHADNVTPRTTAIAAEANPPRRLPVLRTPALTCM